MEEVIRKNIIFKGRVQGVGFRYRAYHAAQEIGLTGWVRNLYDKTVELEAQGKEADIDRLIISLERGSHIQITGMEVRNRPIEKEERFLILN